MKKFLYYAKEFFIDLLTFTIVYVIFMFVLGGIIGGILSFVVIYTDNNYIPITLLSVGAFVVMIIANLFDKIHQFVNYLRKRKL